MKRSSMDQVTARARDRHFSRGDLRNSILATATRRSAPAPARLRSRDLAALVLGDAATSPVTFLA